ncbi:MAG: alkaline phosphatase family protein [Chitinophagales bacterium]|nr:alkaline phosphatase family protein [Chitinophagales bacterium]
MKKLPVLISLLILTHSLMAKLPRVISGPMLGPVELRDAKIWVEVSPEVKSVAIRYQLPGKKAMRTVAYKGPLGNDFNPVTIVLGGLDMNSTYEYTVLINGASSGKGGRFTTKDLWQWRKPVPEFSFLTGSCSYFNEPQYDRLGIPYGKDSSIFNTMATEKAAFMLWLGDAWYTREVDYYSEWGLWNRASHDRAVSSLQPFLKSMPHFATWDDHDYGPNDIGGSYILKETSRKVFNSYFPNTSAGENGQGIYTMINWGDADIFLTDDRWWRSADGMKDSVNGKPNPEKRMLGKQQMDWLKNALLQSTATFKIITVGSQVLNPVSPFDKWLDFPVEYQELMDFLADYKINGVLFLTGDRHHSEIIKTERPGGYPLYDITVSPLTSGTHTFGAAEKNNPYRVFGLDEKQNYARFTFSGERGRRQLKVEFIGVKGEKLGEWAITEKELKH